MNRRGWNLPWHQRQNPNSRQRKYVGTILVCAGLAVFFLFDGSGDDPPATLVDNWVQMLSNEDEISPSLKSAIGHGHVQKRQLEVVPPTCYSNMITNGNFESGLDGWSVEGTMDSIDTIPRDNGTEGSVLRFKNRFTNYIP